MGTSTFSILRHFMSETSRILKLSKKPTRAEFEDVTKITGIGIVILGGAGLFFLVVRAILEGKFF